MKQQPTAELDGYAYDMLLFYLQERNIGINDIDHVEVELVKNKVDKKYYRHINIIFYDRERKISTSQLRQHKERGISSILQHIRKFFTSACSTVRSPKIP